MSSKSFILSMKTTTSKGARIFFAAHLILLSLFLTQCNPLADGSGDQSFGSKGKFTLQGDYGSLAYVGSATFIKKDEKYVLHIPSLRLTFLPRALTNRTERIDAKQLRLVATVRPPSGSGPSDIIAKAIHPLSVSLTAESPTVTLTDVVLEIPTEDVMRADHVGLAVTDERMLWPVGGELKPE